MSSSLSTFNPSYHRRWTCSKIPSQRYNISPNLIPCPHNKNDKRKRPHLIHALILDWTLSSGKHISVCPVLVQETGLLTVGSQGLTWVYCTFSPTRETLHLSRPPTQHQRLVLAPARLCGKTLALHKEVFTEPV